jgi:hypothetical protein
MCQIIVTHCLLLISYYAFIFTYYTPTLQFIYVTNRLNKLQSSKQALERDKIDK